MGQKSVAFYIPRRNMLKIYGPLIRYVYEQRSSDWHPIVVVPDWSISKPQLTISRDALLDGLDNAVEYLVVQAPDDIPTQLRQRDVKVFCTIMMTLTEVPSDSVLDVLRKLRGHGIKTVSLPYTVATELKLARATDEQLAVWDKVCIVGQRSKNWIDERLSVERPQIWPELRDKLDVTGYPELDDAGQFRRDDVLKKYGLPSDRPIVYVSTAMDYYRGLSHLRRYKGLDLRFRGPKEYPRRHLIRNLAATWRDPWVTGYEHHLAAVKSLAENSGAFVIGKSREKHNDPNYIHKYVDKLFYEVSDFPFTTLELLSVSDLYYGFSSASVIEAMASGVYAINALPFQVYAERRYRPEAENKEYFFTGRDGLFNVRGASEMIDGGSIDGWRRLGAIANSTIDDFSLDRDASQGALSNFFAHLGSSSARTVDTFDGLV